MSTTIEEQSDLNPFASPVGSAVLNKVSAKTKNAGARASRKKLKHINRLSIVADLSYVAAWCCFLVGIYFLEGQVEGLASVAYCVTLFVCWYSIVAAFFRTGRPEALAAPILILVPFVGVIMFLSAKQGITEFMICNGYRPRFLGFAADKPQLKAMEEDPDYTPSLHCHLDGSQRKHVYTLGECWIILGAIGFAVFTLGFLVAITCFGF